MANKYFGEDKEFRFWDAQQKKMLYYGFVIKHDGRVCVGDEQNWTRGFLMAWTGLNDKKGEKIWEFDILKHSGFGYDVVVLEKGGFVAHDSFIEDEGCGGSLWVNRKVHEESVVAGNVFEHPTLLQKVLV